MSARAHKIVICPSSVRVAIISESNARISFKFWLLLRKLVHTLTLFFLIFEKNVFLSFFTNIFRSLTWDPMGAKITKRYSSYKSPPKVSKLYLSFLLIVLTRLLLGFLKFWKLNLFVKYVVIGRAPRQGHWASCSSLSIREAITCVLRG